MTAILQAIDGFVRDWGQFILFAGFALVTLVAALLVAWVRRMTHACVALLPCFVGIAALYAMLRSPTMLAFQLLIYAGGIMVLLLFAIFLLEKRTGPIFATHHQILPAGLVAGLTVLAIIGAVHQENFDRREFRQPPVEVIHEEGPGWYAYDRLAGSWGEKPSTNVRRTGFYFLTYYLLPFELTSLILVIAMVGAIIMARQEKGWIAAGRMRSKEAADLEKDEVAQSERGAAS
ncbi:MAG: NADH-quinone oxidoreductase subunit J family protein [Candidatus Zipacnadales bacterium]